MNRNRRGAAANSRDRPTLDAPSPRRPGLRLGPDRLIFRLNLHIDESNREHRDDADDDRIRTEEDVFMAGAFERIVDGRRRT